MTPVQSAVARYAGYDRIDARRLTAWARLQFSTARAVMSCVWRTHSFGGLEWTEMASQDVLVGFEPAVALP